MEEDDILIDLPDGGTYLGKTKDGSPHGFGREVRPITLGDLPHSYDTDYISEIWLYEGELQERYHGEFKEGERDGHGILAVERRREDLLTPVVEFL